MNYWFLYLLSTGEIYHSPYCGEAITWDNVPNGYGAICFNKNNASSFYSLVQDAFNNPMYYIVQNGQLVIKNNVLDILLQNVSTSKIIELDNQCTQTILGGFTSSALGQSHQYGFNYDDQQNLSGRLSLINTNPNYSQPFPWKTLDAGGLLHTIPQFIQVCTDADIFKDRMILKYWTKKNQVNACTSVDQVNKIKWINTTPPSIPTGLSTMVATTPIATTPTTPTTPVTPITPIYVSGTINLMWNVNPDITMLFGGGYNCYVNGVKYNSTLITNNNYSIGGLNYGQIYLVQISAVDTDGNESGLCTGISATAN